MTGKQVIEILQRNGWQEDRQKGSHKIFKNPNNNNNISVPVHGNCDLKIGTLKSILKKAGISLKN